MRFKSPTGSPIVGTYETIPGRANATEFSETGVPIYDGGTEVFWDEQRPIKRDGSLVYMCEDGEQWVFSDLVPDSDEDEDEDEDGED